VTGAPPEIAADVLQPYVPRLLISWLRERPQARHQRIEGTLAFDDISGFSNQTACSSHA
jgi:hypothetical protein